MQKKCIKVFVGCRRQKKYSLNKGHKNTEATVNDHKQQDQEIKDPSRQRVASQQNKHCIIFQASNVSVILSTKEVNDASAC
jgi:hypothetical protein